jgi:hypothetical protein
MPMFADLADAIIGAGMIPLTVPEITCLLARQICQALSTRPRPTLGELTPSASGRRMLVLPAHTTRQLHRNRSGQLTNGYCRSSSQVS